MQITRRIRRIHVSLPILAALALASCGSPPPQKSKEEAAVERQGISAAAPTPAQLKGRSENGGAAAEKKAKKKTASIEVARKEEPGKSKSAGPKTPPPSEEKESDAPWMARLQWNAVDWGGQLTLDPNPENGTLHVRVTDPGKEGKAAFTSTLPAKLSQESLAGCALTVKAGKDIDAAIACLVHAGKDQKYFESAAIALESGTQVLSFRFADKTWKSADTGWQHKTAVPSGEGISQLGFLVYTRKKGSEFLITGIQFSPQAKSD